jgi:hypothetical protein
MGDSFKIKDTDMHNKILRRLGDALLLAVTICFMLIARWDPMRERIERTEVHRFEDWESWARFEQGIA